MGRLREYNVTVNGVPTTMQLNEKDAARLGGTLVEKSAPLAADDLAVAAEPAVKARRPANKARTVKDKSGG